MDTRLDEIGQKIVHAAYEVHKALGPGLLESTYEKCLCYELGAAGLNVGQQICIPLCYKDLILDNALRLDLIVNESVIVELKAVEKIMPVHEAQILSYLRLSKHRLGYLINFHSPLIKNGVRRFVL